MWAGLAPQEGPGGRREGLGLGNRLDAGLARGWPHGQEGGPVGRRKSFTILQNRDTLEGLEPLAAAIRCVPRIECETAARS